MRARRGVAFPFAVLACLAAGCGAERRQLPAATIAPGAPRKHFAYPAAGMAIDVPKGAIVEARTAPGVVRVSLGQSFLAAYAYRRAEQLPRDGQELQAARRRLVAQVYRRDPRFRLIRSRASRVAGAAAVELVGDQRIAGGTFRTRSLHLYRGSGEYVLDMLSPVREFSRVERTLFSPVVGSLSVSGDVRARPRT